MVFQFGWKYMRPYWSRLLLAILLGMLFGAANASMVWATKTLMERFDPAGHEQKVEKARKEKASQRGLLAKRTHEFQQTVRAVVDPWLPRADAAWTWKMVVGGLLFLPLLVLIRSAADYGSSYSMGWISERVVNDMRMDVMHKLIMHFQSIAPTWLLIDLDWVANLHATPYLKHCSDVVVIGRVKWIDGSPYTGKENYGWYHFDSTYDGPTKIHNHRGSAA